MSRRVSYEQKKPVLEEARIDLTNNLELFKNIIGVDFDDEIKLDGSLDFLLELKDIKLPPKENQNVVIGKRNKLFNLPKK